MVFAAMDYWYARQVPPVDHTGATTFTHNLDIDHDVRGFFRSTYTPQPPPTG